VSPVSAAATGVTWGTDDNFDGLPDDWQARFWTANVAAWPAANADSDGDGVSNLQEFLAGTNPMDASSVLKLSLSSSTQGWRLNWNAVGARFTRCRWRRSWGRGRPWARPAWQPPTWIPSRWMAACKARFIALSGFVNQIEKAFLYVAFN
jgi:hypothetical protein